MAELLDEFKKEKSDGMTIRKVTDNIEIIMGGGMLTDPNDDGISEKINSIETNYALYSLEDFSKLEEHVEPKTKREEALELRITVLEDQLAHATTSSTLILGSELRPRKIPVTLSEAQELIVVQYYKDHKEAGIKIKEISAKYNISDRSTSMILEKHGARIPGKRQRRITYE